MTLHCTEDDVWLNVFKDVVVAEERVLRHVQDWRAFDQLIVVMVVHLYDSELQEVNFFHGRLVRDDVLALRDLARVHRNYELIYEASLALVEECIKGLFEFIQCLCLFDQLSLHFWSHLLIK